MSDIVVKDQHAVYIESNLALISNQNKLSGQDLENFKIQCIRTGLDPITRQIYAIPNNGKLTIMASIDGLRLIAERSGAYEGQTAPQWCGDDGQWVDVWLKKTPPAACKIGVYKTKFREPLYAVAVFDEYAGRYAYDDRNGKYKKGDLTHMWAKMPTLMIAKVAESLALRKAFPNEMSGVYTAEEMDQSKNTTQEREAEPVPLEQRVEEHKAQRTPPIDWTTKVITFGKKYAGKKWSDFSVEDHKSYLIYLEDAAKKQNKPLSGPALEHYNLTKQYIEQAADEIPF